MEQVRFIDLTTPNEAWAYIGHGNGVVGLAVFNNWDRVGPSDRKEIEIVMKLDDAKAVVEALRTAIESAPPAMREVAAITFADASTGEATSIVVRHDASSVDLVLCNEDDHENHVAMTREDARALLRVLQTAVGR
jgi:hypothetical protein